MARNLEPLKPTDDSQPLFADSQLTLLWKDASDRDTGADAVVALRARRQQELQTEKQSGDGLRRGLRRRRS